MPDLTLQPTNKWIRIQYWSVFLVLCVCIGLYVNKFADKPDRPPEWLLALPALLFFFPLRGQLRRHFTKWTLDGDKLRAETGFISKKTRTIPISKIQDVRAEQSLGQRLLGIGDVTVENAGSDRIGVLEIFNIDNPQAVVEAILNAQGPAARQKGEPA